MFQGVNFTLIDMIDVFLVSFLMYHIYKILKGTVGINIFIGIGLVIVLYKITQLMQMEMISFLLGNLISAGTIGLIVIFHPEIRKFLLMMGTTNFTTKRKLVKQLNFLKNETKTLLNTRNLIKACSKFSKNKTGALIVIERSNSLDFVKSKGDDMQIEMNPIILESIFYKNGPLHDGAIIIRENTIVATRVVLPLSDKNMPSKLGLRHRAAVGITEKTDALCLVVSEETGEIAFVVDGDFHFFKSTYKLEEFLKSYLD